MSNLQVIDWIFASLILLMVIHGYLKGFIEELFSWAALVLALWAAVILFPAGGAYIRTKTMGNVRIIPELLAFIAIFIIITGVIKAIERILKNVIAGMNLGGVNKILGAVFGIIEGVAITVLAIFLLYSQPLFDPSKILGDSFFARLLLPLIKIPLEKGKDVINTAFLNMPGLRV